LTLIVVLEGFLGIPYLVNEELSLVRCAINIEMQTPRFFANGRDDPESLIGQLLISFRVQFETRNSCELVSEHLDHPYLSQNNAREVKTILVDNLDAKELTMKRRTMAYR
jgi:hypothetical protein